MDTSQLITYLQDRNTTRSGWGLNRVDTKFDTMPSEYLRFAEADLQTDLEHRFINALSNAKRALDCQADRLLKMLGYYKESQDKFWGFPKKILLFQKVDIIAPRVLNKINKTRNLMEHQYIKPNSEQVEDFIDIVSLFIASTDQYASFVEEVKYMNLESTDKLFEDYSEIEIKIDCANSRLLIGTYHNPTEKVIDFEINKDHNDYIDVFRLHLNRVHFV
jgi:hypothetical protein